MKSTTCSAVQAPGGFCALLLERVMPVNTNPGISKVCAHALAHALAAAHAKAPRCSSSPPPWKHCRPRCRRTGDALLGAGVDDQRRRLAREHPRDKGFHTMRDTPEIHRQQRFPALLFSQGRPGLSLTPRCSSAPRPHRSARPPRHAAPATSSRRATSAVTASTSARALRRARDQRPPRPVPAPSPAGRRVRSSARAQRKHAPLPSRSRWRHA